jgi:hypothetical protein
MSATTDMLAGITTPDTVELTGAFHGNPGAG